MFSKTRAFSLSPGLSMSVLWMHSCNVLTAKLHVELVLPCILSNIRRFVISAIFEYGARQKSNNSMQFKPHTCHMSHCS